MQAHGRIYIVKKNNIAVKTDKTGWKEGEIDEEIKRITGKVA